MLIVRDEAAIHRESRRRIATDIVRPTGIPVTVMAMMTIVDAVAMIAIMIGIARSEIVARNGIVVIVREAPSENCPRSAGRCVRSLAIWSKCQSNC